MRIHLAKEIYAINEDKLIYKLYEIEVTNYTGGFYNECKLELVAGHDYINPDMSNAQGFVTADKFVGHVQHHSFVVYPMDETIEGRLNEEGFKIINIEDYKIHGGKDNE
jgi:hypothetical protein